MVHEAYLRLLGDKAEGVQWNSRGHFFGAAAEAMRRILVERARQRSAHKHGGKLKKAAMSDLDQIVDRAPEEVLDLNDALDVFGRTEPEGATLVKLHVFAGFSVEEAGNMLGLSRATAYRQWTYARAWLKDWIQSTTAGDESAAP